MKRKISTNTSRDKWQKAFPVEEAQRAAIFMKDTWISLIRSRPDYFKSSEREDTLTERLHRYLHKMSSEAMLLGFWQNEERLIEIDDMESSRPKTSSRIRKDITYKSNYSGQRLELIFEFKKISLDKNSWRQYRNKNGMRRFVDGRYANGLPLAVMVGMATDEDGDSIKHLRRSLHSAASRDDLRMISRDGKLLFEPSVIFPDVASFDTEHNRPEHISPDQRAILLSHMFIFFHYPC